MVRVVAMAWAPYAEVDDVVRNVFARVLDRTDELRDQPGAGPWLAAVARSVAVDARRSETLRAPAARPAQTSPGETDDHHGATLDAQEVLVLIQKLPETYREVLLLRLVEGMTGPRIAEQLGMSEGAARASLCRGMQQLRALLGWEKR